MAKKLMIGGITLFFASQGAEFLYFALDSRFLRWILFSIYLLCIGYLFRTLFGSEKNH